MIERPGGALVWGTFRPTEQEALKLWNQWNPAVPGYEAAARAVTVEIKILDK